MNDPAQEDSAAPLPRVFCQPSATLSCGACCGMYNHTQADDDATAARLRERTAVFHAEADIGDPESLMAFRRRFEPSPQERLLAELPTCAFLGIVDAPSQRVGCLVHPALHDGIDGRDCGAYDDRGICDDYLCAAHQLLRQHELRLILDASRDSYIYGLILSDVRYLRELFAAAERRNGMSPPAPMLRSPEAVAAACAYFELKRAWPFAAPDGIFGQLRAGEGLETPRRTPPAEALAMAPDETDTALLCLGTEVDSRESLLDARRRVRACFDAFADAVAI